MSGQKKVLGSVYGEGFDPTVGGFMWLWISGYRYLARDVADVMEGRKQLPVRYYKTDAPKKARKK